MIAFEIEQNGKNICTAGADDLAVLSAIVSAVGKLGIETVRARGGPPVELRYSVGGLTSRPNPKKDVHLYWKSATPLRIGDVVQVRIIETDKVDRARLRSPTKTPKARKR
jgi:hypothetical protein